MSIELEIIKVVRHQYIVIERVTISDRLDSIRVLIEVEKKKKMYQVEEEAKIKEVEMKQEIELQSFLNISVGSSN